MCHQVNKYAHANVGITSPLNKNNSPITSAWEDSLSKAPALNVFSSRFETTTSICHWCRCSCNKVNKSKHTIKRGMTTLTSYLDANQIASKTFG